MKTLGKIFLTFCFAITLTQCSSSPSRDISQVKLDDPGKEEVLYKRLLAAGIQESFISYLKQSPKFKLNTKYAQKNVLIAYGKNDYASFLKQPVPSEGIEFIKKNRSILMKEEGRFGVPKEIIVALMSVETRLGKNTGKENVPSVFLSIAMSDQPEVCESIIQDMEAAVKEKLRKRCKEKAEWAVAEIVSLQDMYVKKGFPVADLVGSFAGAFGMTQFLPSSYMRWAEDGDNNNITDLYDVDDAIYSVGNYLKTNGWGNDESQKKAALYHYNHSEEYVSTIMQLAKLITFTPRPTARHTQPKTN